MGKVCITVNLLIDQNIFLYSLPEGHTFLQAQMFAGTNFYGHKFLRAQIFSELIFAIDRSKNRKFRGIIFREFTIGSEIHDSGIKPRKFKIEEVVNNFCEAKGTKKP